MTTEVTDRPVTIVYSLPMCPQCDRTKDMMDLLDIPYLEVDLSKDDQARRDVKDLYGFMSAPVVVTADDAWSGFDPKRIKELA